jgi:hypothetical protein
VFGVLCSAAEAGPAMARVGVVGDEIFKVRGILAQLQVVYMELSEVFSFNGMSQLVLFSFPYIKVVLRITYRYGLNLENCRNGKM